MSDKTRCPHDDAICHHDCDDECFRKVNNMSLSQRGDEAPGVKADHGKPQPRLLPPKPLMSIVDVLTYGAHKYAPDNWKKVPQARERYADALLRHVFAWLDGESHDPESGLHHLSHAGCCILFLLHFELEEELCETNNDDPAT